MINCELKCSLSPNLFCHCSKSLHSSLSNFSSVEFPSTSVDTPVSVVSPQFVLTSILVLNIPIIPLSKFWHNPVTFSLSQRLTTWTIIRWKWGSKLVSRIPYIFPFMHIEWDVVWIFFPSLFRTHKVSILSISSSSPSFRSCNVSPCLATVVYNKLEYGSEPGFIKNS